MADDELIDEYPPLSQLGRSGLPFYAGYVQAETLAALSGHRWPKICKEMQTDTVIGAMLFALEHLIRQVEFSYVPADDSPKAQEYKQFFHDATFNDMSRTWKDTLAEISTFLPWGFAPLELVYKQRKGMTPGEIDINGKKQKLPISKFSDGQFGWHYWPLRGQDTIEKWTFTEYGDIEAMHQLSPPDWKWIKIPMEKLLLFRTTLKSNNPEGKSIIRNAWNSWFYRTNYQRFEGIGVERFEAGLPVFKIPASIINATANTAEYTQLQNYQRAVTNLRRDEQMGLLIPSDRDANGNALYEFSLVNAGGGARMDIEPKIQRLDQRILMSVMMDFLLLGHQKVGSFALADSKTELFITALGSFLDTICDTINRDAVPRLGELNGFQPELLPKLAHGDVETQDLGILGEYIEKLTSTGALTFPTDTGEIESHLLRQGGMPVSENSKDNRAKPKPEEPDAGRAPSNGDKEPDDGEEAEKEPVKPKTKKGVKSDAKSK